MQKVRRQALQPPPKLRVSEFADRELVVTTGPRSGMRWRTSLMPFQAGILDALTEPGIEYCAVMGSAQWGKTSCAVCLVAYHVVHDPTHALIVEPTVDPLAREFSKNRLGPVIEASPALRERMAPATRTKTGSSSTLFKTYRGGSIAIGGANSAASLAVRSVRLLILDEIERFPAELEGEGATIEIALKRTLAYRGRRRIILLSSPKLTGGPIHRWVHRGGPPGAEGRRSLRHAHLADHDAGRAGRARCGRGRRAAHAVAAPRILRGRARRARRCLRDHDGRRRAGRSPRAARGRLGPRRGELAARPRRDPRRHVTPGVLGEPRPGARRRVSPPGGLAGDLRDVYRLRRPPHQRNLRLRAPQRRAPRVRDDRPRRAAPDRLLAVAARMGARRASSPTLHDRRRYGEGALHVTARAHREGAGLRPHSECRLGRR